MDTPRAPDRHPPATAATRKALGAWYTPPELVAAIVAEAVFPGALTVLDPACGDGRFLAASGLPYATGVDIDPRTGFIHDDALTRDWGEQRFDVVLGNPPFLSPLAAPNRRAHPSRFGGGAYVDTAAEFLALAVDLARPGGRVGMVLPQSLLAARDAAAIRRHVDERGALRWMWWSDTAMFDAQVRVWAGVWEIGAAPGPVRRTFGPNFVERPAIPMPTAWSGLIADGPPPAPRPEGGNQATLGDVARFAADFRDQYYGLVGAVGDDIDGPPLITSGLIDPGRCLWGQRPARFAKQRYLAPRVDLDRLSPPMRRWAASRLVPKILIANQTKVVEAVHDVHGAWLPCVPVITCITDRADEVLATLSSPDTAAWIRYHAAGSGLGVGTVRLSPSLLAAVPFDPSPSS